MEAPYWGFTHPSISEDGYEAWFKPCWVYVIASGKDERPVKIGVSRDVPARIKAFEAGNPHGLRAISTHAISTAMARQVERRLHDMFVQAALGREWFDITADEAAAPIPDFCRQAEEALSAYRAAIEESEERLVDAARVAAGRMSTRDAFEQARMMAQARKHRRRDEYRLARGLSA